jgi:GYF domain 2/Domain of unknown function (DUF4190)
LTEKYYIRQRKEENPKKWLGPFDASQLKDLADRRLFSRELHEYSEDRLNWISARQIWATLFPKAAKPVLTQSQLMPTATSQAPTQTAAETQRLAPVSSEILPIDALLAQDDSPEWYFACDGAQQGPVTLTQLRQWTAEGRIAAGDLVWCPKFGEEWVEAQTVPELASTPVPQDPARGRGRSSGSANQTPSLATASFVLGLLGTSLLLGLGSILAVVFGHMALAEFGRAQTSNKGKWMAVAGLALGYSVIAILLIGTVVYIAIF